MVDGDSLRCRARGLETQCLCWGGLCWITELTRAESRAASKTKQLWGCDMLVLKLVFPAFLALEGPDWRERWTW